MKKCTSVLLGCLLLVAVLSGCKGAQTGVFQAERKIIVISREDGSGTRSAFVDLFGVETKLETGEKYDETTLEANITNSTSVVMTMTAGNNYAIGYISLGSLNDSVKALAIDGVMPTAYAIKSGDYTISRPFNIATSGSLSDVAQDFFNYILSADGQEVVEKNGYIAVSDAPAYQSDLPSGKIVVAGSSSVSPVMEKLKEAYLKINFNAAIEIQQSDSTTGMAAVADGICDIGMASRELKSSEREKGLVTTVIALDGIAVIVNKNNPFDEMSSDMVKQIFIGNFVRWEELMQPDSSSKSV